MIGSWFLFAIVFPLLIVSDINNVDSDFFISFPRNFQKLFSSKKKQRRGKQMLKKRISTKSSNILIDSTTFTKKGFRVDVLICSLFGINQFWFLYCCFFANFGSMLKWHQLCFVKMQNQQIRLVTFPMATKPPHVRNEKAKNHDNVL